MPRVGNKHYPYTPEGRAAAARDKRGRGLTATEGFNQPGQLDDAAGRAMYEKGGKVKGFKEGKDVDFRRLIKKRTGPESGASMPKVYSDGPGYKNMTAKERAALGRKKSRKAAGMKKGGPVAGSKSSGRSKASTRADGIARQGHTKGRLV